MGSTNMEVTILYGSQTGNAEDLAKRIGLMAKRSGCIVSVEAMNDFPLKQLIKQKLVIFVCSTTGHGQEPENMKNLYTFLRRRDLPKQCLSSVKFAVYGLGDSSYAKFNYVAKILFKRLKECGAQPVQELVLGDEQHPLGCDGTIYPALDEFWSNLQQNASAQGGEAELDPGFEDEKPESLSADSSYEVFSANSSDYNPSRVFKDDFYSQLNIKTASCIKNQRVTADTHFQDTRLLCFKSLEKIDYEPGDACAIFPENSNENVQSFLKLLNLNPEQRIKIVKKDPEYMKNYLYDFIPDGLKVIDLVKNYLDIQSVPRRSFFQFLWPLSDDQLERDKLREFASLEGQEEMYEYCVQPKRSILEILADFPKTVKNIKLDCLLDMIPPMKSRSFSIASSNKVHPQEIHLLVGIVRYKTRLRKIRKGLCSNYLGEITPIISGESVPESQNSILFFLRSTSFKMPDDPNPMIMVGPGLGVAPFRAFIEERSTWSRAKEETRLYFGCRFKDADFYFRDELESFEVSDDTFRLRVAFSREEPKRYVQDLMMEESSEIRELIEEKNCIVYIAGNSKLPEDLRSLFEKILNPCGQTGTSTKIVDSLEAQGRIQYDCW